MFKWRKAGGYTSAQPWGRFPFGQFGRSGQVLIGLVETRDGKMHVLFLIPMLPMSSHKCPRWLVTSAHDHLISITHSITQSINLCLLMGKHHTQYVKLLRFGAYTHHQHHQHHISITQAHPTDIYCQKDHGD